MIERITDEELLADIIMEGIDGYTTIHSEDYDHSRWHRLIETVFKRESDGKLFIAYWRAGATECQEHEYPDEAVECEEYTVSVVKYRQRTE
jgi:hypothetical protein